MRLSIQEVLEHKGLQVPEEHLPLLEQRWRALESLHEEIHDADLDDYDMGLRNIPGGDHIG